MLLPFTMPYGWAKRPSFQISVIWRWSSNYLHIKKRAQQQLMIRGCVTFWSKNNSAIYIFKKQKFGKNNNVYTFARYSPLKEWLLDVRSQLAFKRIYRTHCAGTVKCGPNNLITALCALADDDVRIYRTLQLVEIGGVDADFVISKNFFKKCYFSVHATYIMFGFYFMITVCILLLTKKKYYWCVHLGC